MFAYVTSQRNHTDALENEVKKTAVRPANVLFTALGASDGHENLPGNQESAKSRTFNSDMKSGAEAQIKVKLLHMKYPGS